MEATRLWLCEGKFKLHLITERWQYLKAYIHQFVIISCQFIKCLEEGYNCGMIRMELTKAGTLTTLMRCELTNEEVSDLHCTYIYDFLYLYSFPSCAKIV